MPNVYFEPDEWRALYAVMTTAELVDWKAYDRARARIAQSPNPGPSTDPFFKAEGGLVFSNVVYAARKKIEDALSGQLRPADRA